RGAGSWSCARSWRADDLRPRVVHAVAARLAEHRRPFLVGIRHHSPVLAAAMPAILDAAEPDVVLLELPEELEPWLAWLGHPELRAPAALAAARRDGR